MSRVVRDVEALPTREKTSPTRRMNRGVSWSENEVRASFRKPQPQWKRERHATFRRDRISEHLMEAA
jgi:hypothetical protein